MRTPFKMKSSPAKGKLIDFFKRLGKEGTNKRQDAQRARNEGGLTNFERHQADRKAQRESGGKSKFQRDIIKKQTDRKAAKATKADKPRTDVLSKNIRDTSDLTVENRASLGEKVYPQPKSKTKSKTKKQTFKQAFASASQAGKKTFDWNGNPYTTELKKKKVKKTETKINTDPVIDIDQDNISDFIQGTTSYHTSETDPSKIYKDFVPNEPNKKNENAKKPVVSVEKGFNFNKTNDYSSSSSSFPKKSPSKKRGYIMKRK
tara:strand:- start:34 stop:816 length:783 start_codon:yes stop_codon:yes gene_type:complete